MDYSNSETSTPFDDFEDSIYSSDEVSVPILKEDQDYSYQSDYGRVVAGYGTDFTCMKAKCKKGESKKMRKIADKLDDKYFTDVGGLVKNQDVKKKSKGMRYILDTKAKTNECKMCICDIISQYSNTMKTIGILDEENKCVSDDLSYCLNLQGLAAGCILPTKKGKDYYNAPQSQQSLPENGMDYSAYGFDYSENPAQDYRGIYPNGTITDTTTPRYVVDTWDMLGVTTKKP